MNLTMYRRLIANGILYATLVFFCSTCTTEKVDPEPAEIVKRFFAKLIEIVEQNSINRRQIDWADYKTKVWAKVGSAQTVQESEPAMVLALALLKDNHSSIIVDNKRSLYGGTGCQAPPALTPFTFAEPNIGYVRVDGFNGSDLEGINFARAIQNEIARQDDENLKGWIVDLRRNPGGNMYPMIAGLGPLIGEGICGYFYDIDNKPVASYAYENGRATLNQTILVQVDKPYQLIKSNPKVAVLIGGYTASSGEASALAFAGRPNTRFLGTATCGLSTGNRWYELLFSEYKLNLFTSRMGDRTGKVYGNEIVPDDIVSYEQAIASAINWINK
jgi:carboxyl-terminal processing protease